MLWYSLLGQFLGVANHRPEYKSMIPAFPDICVAGSHTAASSVIPSPTVGATKKA